MSERDLKLKVLFNLVDRITAPLNKILGSSKANVDSMKALRTKLRELDEQQSQISGFHTTKKALGETSIKLEEAQKNVRSLAIQMKGIENPTRAMSREFELAQKTAKQLKNEHHQQQIKLQELRDKLSANGISTHKISEAQIQLKQTVEKTNAELKEQTTQLEQASKKMAILNANKKLYQRTQALAGRMAMAGAGMGAAGAVGAAALKAPITAFANAEDSKIQLKVSMMQSGGKVSEEFEKINALAMKLGDKLPGTTSDYLDMMTMLQRQGLSAANVLGGTGEATALLAVQLKKIPSEAAEFAAKMQDATRTTEGDMLKLMDTIQRTYYLGVDDGNMLQAFTKMSPALRTLRQEGIQAVNSLAPLIVMFDQVGMKGESGGNAMRKVLDLGMDTEKRTKVNKLLAPQGINLNLSDGKGEFAGIEHMFAEFAKLKHLNTETLIKVLEGQFGTDAETKEVLDVLITKGKAGYDETIRKMQAQADLQTRVNAQLGTLKNLWEAASGTFTNALVAFGESIAPELKALTEWIGNTSAAIGAWARENPVLSSTLMKIAAIITIVLVSLGGLLISISALLMPFAVLRFALAASGLQSLLLGTKLRTCAGAFNLYRMVIEKGGLALQAFKARWVTLWPLLRSGAIRVLSASLTGLTTALKWTGIALKGVGSAFMWVVRLFMNNPILLAIAGLIALVVLIYKNWESVKQFFIDLWAYLKGIFIQGVNTISQFISTAWGWLSSIWDSIWGMVKGPVTALWDFITSAFMTGVNATRQYLSTAWDWVSGIWNTIKTAFSGGIAGVSALIVNWSPIGLFYQAFASVMSYFDIELPAKFTDFGANLINGLITGITSKAAAIKTAMVETAGNISTWFAEKMDIHSPSRVFMRFGSDTIDGYTLGLQDKQNAPLAIVSDIAQRISKLGASLSAGLAISLNTAQAAPIQFDKRAPLASANKAQLQTAQAAQAAPTTIQITINPAPGMDPSAIAKAVAQELDRRDRQNAARQRSSLHDSSAY